MKLLSQCVRTRSTASLTSSFRGFKYGTWWNTSLPVLALLVGIFGTSAQSYSIDWYEIAGGGGTSTGGPMIGTNYSVTGTIGQHDAGGPMTGPVTGTNYYSVTGGFWSLFAVQTPGAPALSIRFTTTNTAVVSWPSPSTGFNLQVNTNLATTNWVAAPAPVDNGTIKYLIVRPPTGNRFYRLKSP